MSPLPDELRTAVVARTGDTVLPPDFLSGVVRRAGRMRRNRLAASVTGGALALAVLVTGGPLLVSSLTSSAPADLARAPEVVTADGRYALDPAAPWPFRGDAAVLENGGLDTYRREYAASFQGVRPNPESLRFVPLYGLSRDTGDVLVFLVDDGNPGAQWGVARSGEDGLEFTTKTVDPRDVALTVGVPEADGGLSLLVLASPETGAVEITRGPGGAWTGLEQPEPGVGLSVVDGDLASDRVRVLGPDGGTAYEGPAEPTLSFFPVGFEVPGTEGSR